MKLAMLVGAVVVAVGLNAQAASLAVYDEGEGQWSVSLVLEPEELVQGFQIDLLIPGTPVVDPPAVGYLVPIDLVGGTVETANPWLTPGEPFSFSGQRVVSGGIRAVHALTDPTDDGVTPGFTEQVRINPDSTQSSYIEVVDDVLGILAEFRDPNYEPPRGVPIARWIGEAPTGWRDARCGPGCALRESGIFDNVPEPTAALLLGLGLAGLGLMRRRARMGG